MMPSLYVLSRRILNVIGGYPWPAVLELRALEAQVDELTALDLAHRKA
jgi:hypothetical protein